MFLPHCCFNCGGGISQCYHYFPVQWVVKISEDNDGISDTILAGHHNIQDVQIGNKTTYRALRKGLIKKVITHVKPSLNTKQKIERLDF